MKRLISIVLLLAIGCVAWAYDFSVNVKDFTLYFSIIDAEDKAVEVVAPMDDGTDRWRGYKMPFGVLQVPAEVEHDGEMYSVVAIGDRAFAGCTSITGLSLPTTLTDIGAYAFYQCAGIRGVLTIGEGIINVGRAAFFGCNGITEVHFDAVACETFGGSRSLPVFGNCRSLTKIKFGNRVRFIPDYAFVAMDRLQFEWDFPQSLEEIGESAFAYCYSIYGQLKIPERVRTIGPYAFAQCHSVFAIDLPARIDRIDQRAFYQCINVRQLSIKAMAPPKMGAEVFAGVPPSVALTVPCVSEGLYKADPLWSAGRTVKSALPCVVELSARAQDVESGTVLGGGSYTLGDTAVLVAVCRSGYGFKGWTDGNMDNPRKVAVVDTTSFVAIMNEIEVVHDIEYIHDTTYMDGIEVIYEYYEVNDVAEPINSQAEVVYDRKRRRVDIPIEKTELVGVALYNDAGQCVMTGKPRRGHIAMRRFPSGYYIVRVSLIDDERFYRFFHNKNK